MIMLKNQLLLIMLTIILLNFHQTNSLNQFPHFNNQINMSISSSTHLNSFIFDYYIIIRRNISFFEFYNISTNELFNTLTYDNIKYGSIISYNGPDDRYFYILTNSSKMIVYDIQQNNPNTAILQKSFTYNYKQLQISKDQIVLYFYQNNQLHRFRKSDFFLFRIKHQL